VHSSRKGYNARDTGKGVVEVIGHPAGKESQGLKLLNLDELFLHQFPVGNVYHNDNSPIPRNLIGKEDVPDAAVFAGYPCLVRLEVGVFGAPPLGQRLAL
jgi:hypothetical protein